MVDEINEETPPDLTNNRVGSLSGVIDQLKRTETNTSRRERKQLAAIKQSNEILSFLYDATEAQIEVNQEAVDAQRLADLQEKERLQEEAKNEKLKAALGLKTLEDGAGKLVRNKGFQAALAATVLGILSIEEVQVFIQEKLVPMIQNFITYMSQTALPFMVENFDKLLIAVGGFVTLTIIVNLVTRIVSILRFATKLWAGIRAGITLFNSTLFDVSQGVTAATMRLRIGKGVIGGIASAAALLSATAIPMMIDTLGLTATTLINTAIGLGVALAPLLVVSAKVAAIIAVGIAVFGAAFYAINEEIERLGIGTFGSLMKVHLATLKDHLLGFANGIIDIAKKVGFLANYLLGLVGLESEGFKRQANLSFYEQDNREKAIKEQRIENRKRLEDQIAREQDFDKAKQLFEELKRIDQLIERDYGIQAPDRDFTDLRVKKLSDDELRLREELQKGKAKGELLLFQNIIGQMDLDQSTGKGAGGSGGGTTFINNGGKTARDPNIDFVVSASAEHGALFGSQ